jgi:hypothetical protein
MKSTSRTMYPWGLVALGALGAFANAGCIKSKQAQRVLSTQDAAQENGLTPGQIQALTQWDNEFSNMTASFEKTRREQPESEAHARLQSELKGLEGRIDSVTDAKVRTVAAFRFYAIIRCGRRTNFLPEKMRQGEIVGTSTINGVTTNSTMEVPWTLVTSDEEKSYRIQGVVNPLATGGVIIAGSSFPETLRIGFKFVSSGHDLVNLDKINSRGSFDEAFLSKVVPGSTELSNQLVDKLLYRKIHDAELLSACVTRPTSRGDRGESRRSGHAGP